jgi:hypothetical protein
VTVEKGLAVGYHRPLGGGTGTWWARVAVPGKAGYPYREAAFAHADDHADANGETVLDWKQAQAAARAWALKQTGGGPLTVRHALDRYIADLRARKGDRAAKLTAGRLDKHVVPILGDVLVSELKADQIRSWLNRMVRDSEDEEDRRRSKDSANRVLAVFKAALNLAFKDGLVVGDRAWRRVQAFKGVGEARKVILSDEDIQRLVGACPKALGELVAAGAMTGCRLGELTTNQASKLSD